jgi:hypothetical protein
MVVLLVFQIVKQVIFSVAEGSRIAPGGYLL